MNQTATPLSLPPVTIISSDEPLLVMEACDAIVKQAKDAGVFEREIVDVSDKFNWNDLLVSSGSMSLFSEVKLTDIRFLKMPNKEAQTALVELIQTADNENLFLVRLPKVEKRQKSTKWFKALTKNVKLQELWPPKPYEFTGWLQKRATKENIQLEREACEMLAEQSEGNLLAAKQALDKLQMLYPEQVIDCEKMASVTADSARYSVFMCLDEALGGNGKRAVKMLHKFKQESLAPISIVVNLTREIELCQKTSLAGLKGENPMQALSKTYLWDSKKRLVVSAVNRLPLVVWQKLLVRCAFLDRMIKGQERGDIWQEIELCLWMLSGQKIWGRAG
jgi:DNA polymerase III subunit delta